MGYRTRRMKKQLDIVDGYRAAILWYESHRKDIAKSYAGKYIAVALSPFRIVDSDSDRESLKQRTSSAPAYLLLVPKENP
jgi:hypothetical protein